MSRDSRPGSVRLISDPSCTASTGYLFYLVGFGSVPLPLGQLGNKLTCTLALLSVARTESVVSLADSLTVTPSQAPRPPTPVICSLLKSSFFSSLGAEISNGAKVYKRSTDVLKIRSSTSGKTVYSSRMKPSNADPVDLRTVQRRDVNTINHREREGVR